MAADLKLDRMALDDVGANPVRLAEAIHRQLGDPSGAVPVARIAKALDIVEIRVETLRNIEGALITNVERGFGSILINENSGRRRKRFTLAHELLHFLNAGHRPTTADGFSCSREDMIASDQQSRDRHLRQEAEANAFAIELLAPRRLIKPHLAGDPDLGAVLLMSEELDISREAAARRYVACHDQCLAVVFSRDGRFVYSDRSAGFPALQFARGAPLPALPRGHAPSGLSEFEDADAEDWFARRGHVSLMIQTLHQQADRATTLLRIVSSDDDNADDGIDDAYERFARF